MQPAVRPRVRPCLCFAIIGLSLLAGSSVALSATVQPGQTIQEAIDLAPIGDTVFIPAGSYSEGFGLREGVNVAGAGVDATTITGSITVPASVTSATSLSDLTGAGLTADGGFFLHDAAFGGTVYLQGSGSSVVNDVEFVGYLVGRGSAVASLSRITTNTVTFTWQDADITYQDSSFGTYIEVNGTSRTAFQGGQLTSIYVYENAETEFKATDVSGTIDCRASTRTSVLDSVVGGVKWSEESAVRVENSSVGRATFVASAGYPVELNDIGFGLVASGIGTSPTSAFSAEIVNSTLNEVAVDAYSELSMIGGGLNVYSFVRDGAMASFQGVEAAGPLYFYGNGNAEFTDSVFSDNVFMYDNSVATLGACEAPGGRAELTGQATLRLVNGSDYSQVNQGQAGRLELDNASLSKLLLTVDEGYGATIQGLVPILTSGAVVSSVGANSPTITQNQGTIRSIELYVKGEAAVSSSHFNSYAVVKGQGLATFQDTTFDTYFQIRDEAQATCTDCNSKGFLYSQDNAKLQFTGGILEGSTQLAGTSVNSLEGVQIDATISGSGSSSSSLTACNSLVSTVKVLGSSRISVGSASDLYAITVQDEGALELYDSSVGTLTFDILPGYDFRAQGLRSGIISGAFGPDIAGPSAIISSSLVEGASVLVKGSASLSDSFLNGYTFVYEGAQLSLADTSLAGVTYFLSDATIDMVGGSVEALFYAVGAVARFDGTRFAPTASVNIQGSSNSEFTRCRFERAMALYGESFNNFGQVDGDNPGLNDFSAIPAGSLKLLNYSPNTVYAQNNNWGFNDAASIADAIWDVTDEGGPENGGIVIYDPFLLPNQPPVVDAGPDVNIASLDQPFTLINGSAVDPDGDALTYRWLEDDIVLLDVSTVDPVSGAAPLDLATVPYLEPGEHQLQLEVTEENGSIVSDAVTLMVDNSSPVAVPNGGGTYADIDLIVLGGEVADYDGDTLSYQWSVAGGFLGSGVVDTLIGGSSVLLPELELTDGLPIGTHTLTLEVSDGVNLPVLASLSVSVVDTLPPTLSPVAEPSILWPPNGDMVPVLISTYAMDASGQPVHLSASVSMNETCKKKCWEGDWSEPVIDEAAGTISLELRAERDSHRRGRVYTISIIASDDAGNRSYANVQVRVPRWGYHAHESDGDHDGSSEHEGSGTCDKHESDGEEHD